MYIIDKYWGNYIGGTDDSLTLVEHLAGKRRDDIPLGELLSDFGLDKLNGDFRAPDTPLTFTSPEGWETPIYYAIDLIADLAALLLECRISGGIDMGELSGGTTGVIRLTATPEEHELINRVLADFASEPMAYDLSEMVPEEDMLEMATVCQALRAELYG